MNINWIISILVHKGVLTLEEGEHLAQELVKSIHSQTFEDAHRTVDKLLSKLESKRKVL